MSSQRGSVSVLLAAGILIVLVLVLGVTDLGRVLIARSKARTAADAAALAAADELALPSGADPAELAATVRQARRAATLERARTAPVKMLFPLVFLILPAFLLLTVVPVLLTTVRSIR